LRIVPRARGETLCTNMERLEEIRLPGSVRARDEHDSGL
jgi:hypothetical protein